MPDLQLSRNRWWIRFSYTGSLRLSVKYLDVAGKPIDVKSLKQGTEFTAVVTIKILLKNRLLTWLWYRFSLRVGKFIMND